MDAATRKLVRQRAGDRCEYCRMPAHALDLPFHVEHIIASAHRRDDRLDNLALACARCNLKKRPNLATIDPETDEQVAIYHPRAMDWDEHFQIRNGIIVGITSTGRGTVRLLDMNSPQRVEHRRALIAMGSFDS